MLDNFIAWLVSNWAKNNWITCVCPKNRGHLTDLAAEPITFSKWSQYILCAFFLLFSTCSFDTEHCSKHKNFFPSCDSLGNHTRYLTKRAKHLYPQGLGWHTPIYICVAYNVEYRMITFSGISHCNLGGGGKTNSGSPLQWPSSL